MSSVDKTKINKNKSLPQRVDKGLTRFEKGLNFLSGVALILTMLLITIDAVARTFFNHPITGVGEIVEEYLLALIVFLSMSFTYTLGGHVKVDILSRLIPDRIMAKVNILLNFLGFVMFALLTYAGIGQAIHAAVIRQLSTSPLAFPLAPIFFCVPLGFGCLTLRLLQSLLESVGLIKRSEHEQVDFAEV